MITAQISDAEILAAAQKLPLAPRLLVELGGLINDPDVESAEVVAVLRQDPMLVGQVIRMANSVVYSPAEPVGSIERAVVTVGFSEVHRLVGAIAGAQLSEQTIRFYPIDGPKLRLNSLFVAVLMEELAKWCGESPRSCYTVGLLRTIGIMGLERIRPLDESIPEFKESGEKNLAVWEAKRWGLSNPEVAERILVSWGLPNEAIVAVRHHYDPAWQTQSHYPSTEARGGCGGLLGFRQSRARRPIGGFSQRILPRPESPTKPSKMRAQRAHAKFDKLRIAIA